MLEMQLWVQSDNPDYKEAVKERLAELRAKAGAEKKEAEREWSKPGVKEAKEYRAKLAARQKRRIKVRENAEAFAVRLAVRENREQFSRDLFDGLLAFVPRERSEPLLCASPPKEEGGLSDSEFWNGYEWEKD